MRLRIGAEARLARGVAAGLAAGLLFLLANVWYADSQGLPAVAPLYDISAIFHFADKPQPSPENLAIGLMVHLTLSAGFGAAFALLAPLVSGSTRLVGAAAIFGLVLERSAPAAPPAPERTSSAREAAPASRRSRRSWANPPRADEGAIRHTTTPPPKQGLRIRPTSG